MFNRLASHSNYALSALPDLRFWSWFTLACSVFAATGLVTVIAKAGVLFPFAWTVDYTQKAYGVVVDAGSHGTRVHLYEWKGRVEDPDHPLTSPVTIPDEILSFDGGGDGLSSYASKPSAVCHEELKPLLDAVRAKLVQLGVDSTEWDDIPLYIKATAGMRNMDLDSRDSVMASIRTCCHNKLVNPFRFKNSWARVISGEEEGVFAWISVNNIMGTLLMGSNSTVGAVEMGGASTQITFSPNHNSVLEDFYELNLGGRPLHLYSHSFIGYGWGDASMRLTTRLALETLFHRLSKAPEEPKLAEADQVLQGLVPGITVDRAGKGDNAVQVGEINATHPCFPIGYNFTFDIPSLIYPDGRYFLDMDVRAILEYLKAMGVSLDAPVIRRNFPNGAINKIQDSHLGSLLTLSEPIEEEIIKSEEMYRPYTADSENSTSEDQYTFASMEATPFRPFSEPLPLGKLVYQIHFSGTSDFEQCQARAKELFYQEPCFLHTCSFNGIYQPRIEDSRFVALGQFVKVQHALGIPRDASPNTLEIASANVCRTDYKTLLQKRKDGDFPGFGKKGIVNLCWKSMWAHSLLTYGLGFDGATHALDLGPPHVINSTVSAGWALGSMIYEISFFPWETSRGRFVIPFLWALISTMCCAALSMMLYLQNRALRFELADCKQLQSNYFQLGPE